MDSASESSATEAMIRAAIQAEEAHARIQPGSPVRSTMDRVSIHPSFHQSSRPTASDSHLPPSPPARPSSYNKSRAPAKSSAPPPAIHIDSPHLTERIANLQKFALIGRWYFPCMEEPVMRKWIAERWKPIIGYSPIISHLMKEWFCFHFIDADDVDAILRVPWVQNRSFLALHRWFIGFDPLKNTPSHNLIWVKIPNLPLEMWSKEVLEIIGNSIGRFVYVDPWCIGERDKRIAWILIERTYRGGYPEQVDITWCGRRISQRLDFWGVPFRCAACHKTGHLIDLCPRKDARRRRFQSAAQMSRSHPPHSGLPQAPPPFDPVPPLSASPRLPSPSRPPSMPPASIPEPSDDPPIRSPSPIPIGDIDNGSFPIFISSSPPPHTSPTCSKKGKEPITATPVNSPSSSPVNLFDSDIDLLLHHKSTELEPLTIHKPFHQTTPSISPASGRNITVRKTTRGGSRHFRGRPKFSDSSIRSLSLVDIPIIDMSHTQSQPLRADAAGPSAP